MTMPSDAPSAASADGGRPGTGSGSGPDRVGPNPSGVLNGLVMEIARASGENPREVNLRLNGMLGVESRINQSEDVIRGAVAIARDWLDSLAQPAADGRVRG